MYDGYEERGRMSTIVSDCSVGFVCGLVLNSMRIYRRLVDRMPDSVCAGSNVHLKESILQFSLALQTWLSSRATINGGVI